MTGDRTDTPALPTDRGICGEPLCDEVALIYVAYSPYGKSPRLLMLAGEKAAMLEQLHGGAGVLSMRCVEHACRLVEDLASGSAPNE